MPESAETEMLTTREAAALLNKHVLTINRWIREGKVPAKRAGKHGAYMISKQDLLDALDYTPPAGDGRQPEKA